MIELLNFLISQIDKIIYDSYGKPIMITFLYDEKETVIFRTSILKNLSDKINDMII